jgi:hypothetical protein
MRKKKRFNEKAEFFGEKKFAGFAACALFYMNAIFLI